MARPRSTATEDKQPTPHTNTVWSAAYTDVGGDGPDFLDPNEIGLDPLPDEVRDQFDALAAAARAIIGTKAMGMDMTFNVVLEGAASPGHQDTSEYAKVSVAKGQQALSIETESTGAAPAYVVTSYTDEGAPEEVEA